MTGCEYSFNFSALYRTIVRHYYRSLLQVYVMAAGHW